MRYAVVVVTPDGPYWCRCVELEALDADEAYRLAELELDEEAGETLRGAIELGGAS